MATLPVFPTFAIQETPTLTKLQQLAGAVSFVSEVPIVVSLKRSSTQSITAATATAVQWNVSEVDSDGMHSNVTNPSRLTAQTQGFYRMHATLALSIPSAQEYKAYFQQTTSTNNPLGSGVTQIFAGSASLSVTTTSDIASLSIRSLTPCLYVGDYVEVFVFAGASCNLQSGFDNTGTLDFAGFGDGASCLTGYYVCEGP
jgi:hypothetical protein